jgi:hypothetical protein
MAGRKKGAPPDNGAPPRDPTLPSPPTVHGRPLLHIDWIREVAATPENDLRAHRIAFTYHHLARYLDELLHKEQSVNQTIHKPLHERTGLVRNANWFNFATWATLTVSQNIGNQQPLQRLNSGPAMLVRRILTPAILSIKASRGQEVGRALAWGQLVIFNAACRALMRLVDHLDNGGELTMVEEDLLIPVQRGLNIDDERAEYARFVTPLNDALRYLAEACRTEDVVAKARLILGANLRITQVEQDFADKAVSIVVDLVPRRLFDAFDWQLARLAERFRGMPTHLSFLVLQNLHAMQRYGVDAIWSRFMTDQVLVMALPCETLRVGRDIPPLRRDRPYYPVDLTFPNNVDELRQRDDDLGERLVELALLVRSLDRTVDNGRGSAARDWRRWDERLNWALTLLRTRQHDESLFWHPYSHHDEGRIVRGEMPLRSGDPSALDVQPPLDPAIERRADTLLRSGEFGGDSPSPGPDNADEDDE